MIKTVIHDAHLVGRLLAATFDSVSKTRALDPPMNAQQFAQELINTHDTATVFPGTVFPPCRVD